MSKASDRKIILNPSRRRFFGQTLALGGAATVGLGFHPLATTAMAQAIGGRRKTLVYVFLRGGNDGLSLVVPRQTGQYQAAYNDNRQDTRVETTLPTNTPDFGLHPACEGLQDLMMNDRNLAIIHGCGHLDPDTYTRSHFDAQEQVDLGTPGEQTSNTGWLTRYLETADDAAGIQPLFSALVSGGNPPQSVNGWPDVATVDSANGFSPNPNGAYEEAHLQLLAEMYDGSGSLDNAVSTAMLAIEEINDLDLDNYSPAGNVSYRDSGNRTYSGVHADLELAASVIRSNLGVGVVTIDVGGWDTHNDQGSAETYGGYYNRIGDLSDALTVFYKDMVAAGYEDDVAVIVQTEFGRQVRENANRGTDHGLANPMMVLGSRNKIRSGIRGQFPGFDDTPGNAFKPTRDFRDIMIAVAHGVLGNPAWGGGQSSIFPGYNHGPVAFLLK